MRFRSASENTVLETGTAIAVIGYSVLTVLLLPYAMAVTGATSALGKIIGILVSAVGLFALIRITLSLLLRYWAKPVLGLWAYRSSSGNFALMYLEVEDSSLHYRVDVYETVDHALSALNNEPRSIEKCIAHAYAKALSYRDGVINLIYRIDRTAVGYPPREGVLTLELMPGGRGMKGYWHSNVEGEAPQGTLDVYREDAFRSIYTPTGPKPVPKGGRRRLKSQQR